MKIWYQSASSYGFEPVFEGYGKALEEQCRRAAAPGTEVHVKGIQVMAKDIVKYKAPQYYQKIQILNNMLQAQAEGYDAFAIGCTLDDALEEGKAFVDIPVVGIAESGFHQAMMLGGFFAVITNTIAFCNVFEEQAQKYGATRKFLPGPYICTATGEEIAEAIDHPDPLMAKVFPVAEKAVEDGASVLLFNPTYLATLAYRAGVAQMRKAVVLDTVSILVKTAEMMAGLKRIGIESSRQIGVCCKPDKEKRLQILESYKKVFKIID
ncbi:MAG: aspartate/glutamate racemase family protein [Desulfobacterales bacterium]|nr:aspartate/glutamate racemase family protein [Desulfobacterales bacterium]